MPYKDGYFDLVLSNSLVHHLPNPLPFFQEVKRVLKPKGGLLLRDLLRPDSPETVAEMVNAIGSDYSSHQKQLFQDSLCAAFTLSEIGDLLAQAGLTELNLYQSSDRHWTAEKKADYGII
jgi:SAM-dependent methyltransferase